MQEPVYEHYAFSSGENDMPDCDDSDMKDLDVLTEVDALDIERERVETQVNCAPFVVEWRRSDGRLSCNGFDSEAAAEAYAEAVRGIGREPKVIAQGVVA